MEEKKETNVKKEIRIEEIEAIQPKERPLYLEPIVIAHFGDICNELKQYINCLYKATGYTFPSKPQCGPGG